MTLKTGDYRKSRVPGQINTGVVFWHTNQWLHYRTGVLPDDVLFSRPQALIHITIVHQGALGDSILLIPLVRSLRQRFAPDACAFTLVTKSNLGQMMMLLGFVEAYASADDREHSAWFAPPDQGKANSSPAWALGDILISAVSNGADAWAENARLARVAANVPVDPEDNLLFFNPKPPPEYRHHVTHYHREQLASLELQEPLPDMPRSNPDGAILIHPGSGGDTKCWPRERFLSLSQNLKRLGFTPTMILGEVEQERWGPKLINDLKEEYPWYLHMGLYELGDRISRARYFVGNDAGVTHLAAALGVPTLVLFGPSNDVQWRPIGPEVTILRPSGGQSGMEALDEETVLAEMLAELRKL